MQPITYTLQWATPNLGNSGISKGSTITVEPYPLAGPDRTTKVVIEGKTYLASIDPKENLTVSEAPFKRLLMSQSVDSGSGAQLIYGEAVIGDPEGTGGFGGQSDGGG